MIITHHACERYIERVDGSLTLEQAKARIAVSERAILAAAAFGCPTVRQGTGAKLVLSGATVVTVIARGQIARGTMPIKEGRL